MLDRLTIERMATPGDAPILIALSGGGDSVALLHLLVEHFGAARLSAAIVDHALRSGSDDDAQRALGLATELGVAAHILTLTWPQGAGPAQQGAREARYAALCAHARSSGAHIIAVAHTADDQAETVLMRAAAGSGWRGLAGIAPLAPAPLWPEGRALVLARPLLSARRDALRALLHARGAHWIEDPANANPAFERVRVRAHLAELEQAGFDPVRLARVAEALRARVDALNGAAAALVARAARFDADRVVIARSAWEGGAEIRRRALSALIAAAAGARREPPPAAVADIERRMNEASFSAATLGGARLSRAGGDVLLQRDRGAVEGRADGVPGVPPLPLTADVETVWDGRLAVIADEEGVSVAAGPRAPVFIHAGADASSRITSMRWLLAERTAHALAAPPCVP